MPHQEAADLLREAGRVVILTGAGISTPSGIPDFRSTQNGLWQHYDPMEVASLTAFRMHPERFFAWIRPLLQYILDARPNPAHDALAALEVAGRVHGVITQNIDGLHLRAGSKTVHEVHGTLNSLTCVSCYTRYPAEGFIQPFVDTGIIPICPRCGHVLKPDVILFEEQLPLSVWNAAEQAACECDLMLVAGSSLEVMPVAGLPMAALRCGAKIIVVNQSPTYVDARAEVVVAEDVATALPKISELVLNG